MFPMFCFVCFMFYPFDRFSVLPMFDIKRSHDTSITTGNVDVKTGFRLHVFNVPLYLYV